jgi:transmembrane sensor
MTAGPESRKAPVSSAAADAAGDWDARLRAPDCTLADREDFAAWQAADPAHREAYERLQTIVASIRHDRSRADVRALRDEALRAVGNRRNRRRLWVSAAVASVIAFGICAALWRTATVEWLRAPLYQLVGRLTETEYATGIGQRSTLTLDDGSTVDLDAQSRIKVAFSEYRRDVELSEGQVMFNVAKNPRRPFIVRAGNREIIAVGTQFDVRLDSRSVQVTLIEGKVRVQRSSSSLSTLSESARPGGEMALGTAETVTLTPGKQLIAKLDSLHVRGGGGASGGGKVRIPAQAEDSYSSASSTRAGNGEGSASSENENENDSVVRSIDIAKVTGWREGRVVLDDLSLEDAVAEMNKYSSTQIIVTDPALVGLRVTGMFKAGGQQAFVTALESYFPIVAQRHGEKEIVLTYSPHGR